MAYSIHISKSTGCGNLDYFHQQNPYSNLGKIQSNAYTTFGKNPLINDLASVHKTVVILAVILVGIHWKKTLFKLVEWLFLAVPQGCLRFVIVVFPDHTHLLFWMRNE